MCFWERSLRYFVSLVRVWLFVLVCLVLLVFEFLYSRNENLFLFILVLFKKFIGFRCFRCRFWGRKISFLGIRRGCNGVCFWREIG